MKKKRRRWKKWRRWTEAELIAAARPYNSRSEFMYNNNTAYQSAYQKGILDTVCAHMPASRKKNHFVMPYPNLAALFGPAMECDSLKEFMEKHSSAYTTGMRLKISWTELFANKENPRYLQKIILSLSTNAACGTMGKNEVTIEDGSLS